MEGQKRSISEIAHMSTLSEEEAGEVDEQGLDVEAESPDYGVPADRDTAVIEKTRMEHTDPCFFCEAKPGARDMYDFMMYHTYFNAMGVLSILIGIGALVALILNIVNKGEMIMTVLLVIVEAMFLANSPAAIWFRAKKQAESIGSSANTIKYTFSPAGVDMSRGKEYAAYTWDKLAKIKEVKEGFYFYLTKNSAFVIPKADIGAETASFRNMLAATGVKKLSLLQGDARHGV